MQQPPLKEYALNNIAVGDQAGRIQETPVRGNMFCVLESTHSRFTVQINDGDVCRGKMALGHVFPVDFEIEKIRIVNTDPTGLALSLVIQVGKGTPLNFLFNVSADEVAPLLRTETPLTISEGGKTEGVDGVAVNTWVILLPANPYRKEVWLKTDAVAGDAFWSTSNPGAPSEVFSRDIQATADTGGFLRLALQSAIWVRIKTAGKSVRAVSFDYAT